MKKSEAFKFGRSLAKRSEFINKAVGAVDNAVQDSGIGKILQRALEMGNRTLGSETVRSGLMGAGLGAVGGGLYGSVTGRDKNRALHMLKTILAGGALGGGIGAAHGAGRAGGFSSGFDAGIDTSRASEGLEAYGSRGGILDDVHRMLGQPSRPKVPSE